MGKNDPRRVAHVYLQWDRWVAVVEGKQIAQGLTREEVESAARALSYRPRGLVKSRPAWTGIRPAASTRARKPRRRASS